MFGGQGLSGYGFTYDNWGANPSLNAPGASITPGASNAEGSWTQVATSGNVAQDCYWLWLAVINSNTSAAAKSHLLDIGIDPAGGTSYTAVVSNIVCGSAPQGNLSGVPGFLIPFYIKAGSSIAVRMQGSNATAGTARVCIKLFGQPSNPENVPVGQYSETIGTITGSQGVTFTPGNVADGTWVSLGSTSRDLWWWQLGVQLTSSAMTGNTVTYIDLAFGDGTNFTILHRALVVQASTEAMGPVLPSNLIWPACYWPVPAGSTLYVRGRGSAAPDATWNAVAVGIGG